MDFWLGFWTVVLVVAAALMTGLAIVVSIGGFFDMKAMFKSIHAEHESDAPDE